MNELSIIIPYYRGENFLFNCIDSILEAYNASQKKISIEIIVVIDSPAEYSEHNIDVISPYKRLMPVKILINEENIGVAASRNKGLKASRYDFVTFIDQDDQVTIDYFTTLESQVNPSDYCIFYNGYRHYMDTGVYQKLYFTPPDLSFNAIIREHFLVCTPGLMIFNKKVIQIPDYFIDVSDKYKGCDDWAATINLVLLYPHIRCKYIKKTIFIHNRHSANFSNNLEQMYLCPIAILEYFREKVDSRKQKIIDRMIKVRTFQAIRNLKPLSKIELLRNYKKVYLLYLFNKYGYFYYPAYKLLKIWNRICKLITI